MYGVPAANVKDVELVYWITVEQWSLEQERADAAGMKRMNPITEEQAKTLVLPTMPARQKSGTVKA